MNEEIKLYFAKIPFISIFSIVILIFGFMLKSRMVLFVGIGLFTAGIICSFILSNTIYIRNIEKSILKRKNKKSATEGQYSGNDIKNETLKHQAFLEYSKILKNEEKIFKKMIKKELAGFEEKTKGMLENSEKRFSAFLSSPAVKDLEIIAKKKEISGRRRAIITKASGGVGH